MVLKAAVAVGVLVFVVAGAIVVLVASPPPPVPPPRDVFGFAGRQRSAPPHTDLPPLKRFAARDGAELAYRVYDSPSDQVLIFLHGSSYHGAGYHALAKTISDAGAAMVVLPNLRGHYQSGVRRGDVDYVGQLEDDLVDLIAFLRSREKNTSILLGGHSSGAGLAIRFAGGDHAAPVAGYLLLSPIIPTSSTLRNGDAGGWSVLHGRRLAGLILANALGIHGLNGLPILVFNKPVEFWDGTETLTYSYRLNTSYHPGPNYRADLAALPTRSLVVVGENDQAIDVDAMADLLAREASEIQVWRRPDLDHFDVFEDPGMLEEIATWLESNED